MIKPKIKVLILSAFCLVISSCNQEGTENIEETTIEEISNDYQLSSKVSNIDTSSMQETDFNNGQLDPFAIRTTAGGNTVKVISQRAKFNWQQKNYNGRLTRMFKGAEIESTIQFDEEVYVGFKVYIPKSTGSVTFPNNRHTTITQFLSIAGCTSWSGMLEIRGNDLYIHHRNTCGEVVPTKILTDIPRAEWLNFQIRWKPSNNNRGAVEVRYNDASIYSKKNINFGWGDFVTGTSISGDGNNWFQIKYGMYAHDAHNYTGNSYTNESRTIYFDNVSARQGSNGWNHVKP